ncbi:MAG: APC family permease [Deltaproteobacteria bacterium]|nr:APC family permease [Deltaproteobacteria bacterium]
MRPPRTLGFSSLVALTFFCVAGGAYGLEDTVGAAGPMLALLAILLVPWLWSFPTALMTAELATAMPEDGGYVVWVQRAFGRFWGFQEGWWSWLCSFADNALYPVMFVDYLAYLRGEMLPLERWLLGVAMIMLVAGLNIRGTQLVGRSAIVFACLVLAPFAVVVFLGAPRVDPAAWLTRQGTVEWGLLLSIMLWNTCGWDNAGCCAGEVQQPEKVYPRAMAATVVLVTLSYLLPVAVGVGVDRRWGDWQEGYFPTVAAQLGGPWLGTWLTAAGLVSALGLFNSLLCTSARIPYAMAVRGMLPAPLAILHPRYGTPWVAVLVNSVGVAALIPFSFQELIELDMFLYALALIPEFAALVWLRFKEPQMPRPYRVPFGVPGVLALSVPPVALCLLSMGLAGSLTKIVSLAGILAGVVVFQVREFSLRKSGQESKEVTAP